jgi:hypothetical protein
VIGRAATEATVVAAGHAEALQVIGAFARLGGTNTQTAPEALPAMLVDTSSRFLCMTHLSVDSEPFTSKRNQGKTTGGRVCKHMDETTRSVVNAQRKDSLVSAQVGCKAADLLEASSAATPPAPAAKAAHAVCAPGRAGLAFELEATPALHATAKEDGQTDK